MLLEPIHASSVAWPLLNIIVPNATYGWHSPNVPSTVTSVASAVWVDVTTSATAHPAACAYPSPSTKATTA